MIEVLWIDDECLNNKGELTNTGVEVIETAFEYGIKITPKLTYKEGIEEININPLKWCAVILDIHNQKSEKGKASDDFDKAREDIIRIQAKKNQQEPYIFVLSGNKQYQTESSTIRKPDYCQKNIYDKNGKDYKLLFEDILKIQNISKLYTCQEQYKDVLDVAKRLSDDTWEKLLILLLEITVNNEKKNTDLFNRMRKVLGSIKQALEKSGYPYFTETKGDFSFNSLSRHIGNDTNIPVYIRRAFHTLTCISQDGSHGEAESPRLVVDRDVSNLKAPYLLRSCLFELCNILIWLDSLNKNK